MSLMVDGVRVDHVLTSADSVQQRAGSVQAVVQLSAGQRVWLRCDQHSHFYSAATAFTGFLIHAD